MARRIGIIVLVVALCALLAAVIFPVFAQAKYSAKRTAALAEFKRHAIEADMRADDATAKLASYTAAPRAVIRKARLSVLVRSLDQAESDLKTIVAQQGGYVEEASGWDLASPTPSLTITTRVPEARFDSSLALFENLGQRTAKSISAEDVTEQIVDMDARLKTMLAQEEVYRSMLKKVSTIGDATHMQDALMKLREDIESMTAQRKSLATQAALSSIEVTMQQKANPAVVSNSDPNWGSDAWDNAVSAATLTFHFLGVAAIWLVVFSPLWLAPLLIVLIVHRTRKRAAQA